ncbi:flagellar hook-length control protein FliK [Borrelia sp. HM]|uniref:flagellar hook-length control protein FliK n=1 Tax=Borrelia sp. HM TaxID=1882662 RepID=UPI001C75185D|nr:flagellar hook-length control protein FliK [Borrelia sp. HM]BCR21723.1 flagellar hook-length control protein FliK [Borrelia sp. HM]
MILDKIGNNSQGLIKGLNLIDLNSGFTRDSKSVFSNLIFSEIKNLSQCRDLVQGFIKFLKNNGLIDNNFKSVSLKQSFIFEKLSDNSFISDLKSLLKKVEHLFNFENLEILNENLSFDSGFVNKKELSNTIENFLSDLNILFNNMNSLYNFDVLGIDFDSNHKELDFTKKDKESNIINIDVKNFKKNDNVKEFLNSGSKFRLVDSENSIGKYEIKETFDGITRFMGDLNSFNVKHMRESFISQMNDNLMSEWNLKINHNIVNKAKVVLKSNDTGEIRLILKPQRLGSIRINLNLDSNNNLLGKIIVDNHNVRALFEQNMYSLNKMLNDNGFNSSLNLSLAGSGSRFFSGDSKDDFKSQESPFNKGKIFKVEDDVEISDDLEKSINFIV